LRVFINARGIDVPAGATALDAVSVFSTQSAGEVTAGARLITDSRGLPIDPATPMAAGSILRLVANRAGARDGGAESLESDDE
jgi:hypothetical protein